MGRDYKIMAFTLAETLITLAIIGVVAALVIPSLMYNINQNVFNSAQDLALKKIRVSTDLMRTDDVLSGYATSDAFADAFQKYIKVAKRCDSSNLQDCFSSVFLTGAGENINLSDLHTGADFGHDTYTSPLVGIGLINGTSMILAFDPDCQRIEPSNNTIDTTSCLAIIYDVNGSGKPNQIGKDIALLNATITDCDGIKIGGLCVAGGDTTYTPINTCTDTTYDSNLTANAYCSNNSWAGAKKACAEQGMRLPSKDELNTIFQNAATISGLSGSVYWSATEYNVHRAWYSVEFNVQGPYGKDISWAARCVK